MSEPSEKPSENRRRRRALHFLRAFVSSPRSVGAVLPSSRELAQEMVRGIELRPGDTVLELGPGTGALTAQIRELLPEPGNYLGIEREPRFVRVLEDRFPELRFVEGQAEEAPEICRDQGLCPPRVIISGLPFVTLPAPVQDRILDSVSHLLDTGGTFRTFQYVHGYVLPSAVRFRRRTEHLLGCRHRLSQPLLGNLPPAYVLTWEL